MKHRKTTMPIIIPNQSFYTGYYSYRQEDFNDKNRDSLTLKPVQLPTKPPPRFVGPNTTRTKTRINIYKSVRTINN